MELLEGSQDCKCVALPTIEAKSIAAIEIPGVAMNEASCEGT